MSRREELEREIRDFLESIDQKLDDLIHKTNFLGLLGELGCSKTSLGLPFWKRNVSGNKLEYVFKFLFPCLIQVKN